MIGLTGSDSSEAVAPSGHRRLRRAGFPKSGPNGEQRDAVLTALVSDSGLPWKADLTPQKPPNVVTLSIARASQHFRSTTFTLKYRRRTVRSKRLFESVITSQIDVKRFEKQIFLLPSLCVLLCILYFRLLSQQARKPFCFYFENTPR